MTDQRTAARLYTDALVKGDEDATTAVAGYLADDIVAQSNFGRADGKEAVLASFKSPTATGLLAAAQWGEVEVEDHTARVEASLSAGMPVAGFDFAFWFNDAGQVRRVEQQMIPAPPLEPTDLKLSEDIQNAVNNALDNGTPILAAYVDHDGQPHLSFRGTTQVYSENQLAMWAREPSAGMPQHVPAHPRVTLLYHDPKTRTTYSFYGRARVVEDEAIRKRIFDNSNPREQHMDFRQRGVAFIVDLDRVEGTGSAGRVRMERR